MAELSNHSYAVILAGGGGTRLWPKSRKAHPKHLLKLLGEETLLRLTFGRLVGVIPIEKIFVVTLSDHADLVKEELPELPDQNIIVEPEGKNTALAIGLGAIKILSIDPDAVILNLHSDQIVSDQNKFLHSIQSSIYFASTTDNLVTIGVKPTYPHTGLGYINIGEKVENNQYEGYKVVAFKEKPDLATAEKFLESGKFLWNTGMYCWKAKVLMSAFLKLSPDIYEILQKVGNGLQRENSAEIIADLYRAAPTIAIDVAVSEKADNILVVKGDFPWSDVGDWNGVYDILDQKDENGNLVLNKAEYECIDSSNCLIDAHGKLVVTIGVENVVIIDTKDAILVCDKSRTQEVKKIVERLKEQAKHHYL